MRPAPRPHGLSLLAARALRLWTPRQLGVMVLTAAVYYAGARIGLLPALVRGQVTPFWPPTGIPVASLLLFGVRCWPGIAIASFAVNAPLGPSVLAAFGIAAGSTLAPVLAVLALRALRVSLELGQLRDATRFVLVAISSMLVSATWGTTVLAVSGGLGARDFWGTWSVWWAGDAMGVLVVTPVLLLAWSMRHSPAVARSRVAEGAVVLILVAAVMRYFSATNSPALLLICPLLVWSAVRLRQLGAALVALEVAVLASAAAGSGTGAFVQHSVLHSMVVLQIFNASVALTGLLLAATISQLDDSRRDLAIANLMLAHRFEHRGAELAHDRRRIAVLTDRYRIATQVHDSVLQRLFGVGTALQAGNPPHPHPERFARLVDELDATINDLATAIYQTDDDGPGSSFADAVDHVVATATHPTRIPPTVTVSGPGDTLAPIVRAQVLAALHDVAADLAGTMAARRMSVTVAIADCDVCVTVVARHVAGGDPAPPDGIRRARSRAERLGGSSEWRSTSQSSTVQLSFPLDGRPSGRCAPTSGSVRTRRR